MKHKKIYSNYNGKQIKNLIGRVFQGHIIIRGKRRVPPLKFVSVFIYLGWFPPQNTLY